MAGASTLFPTSACLAAHLELEDFRDALRKCNEEKRALKANVSDLLLRLEHQPPLPGPNRRQNHQQIYPQPQAFDSSQPYMQHRRQGKQGNGTAETTGAGRRRNSSLDAQVTPAAPADLPVVPIGCNAAEEEGLADLGLMTASLINRTSILLPLRRLAEGNGSESSYNCTQCVLATVNHVCGPGCVGNHLHLDAETTIQAFPCLPSLAAQLSNEQTVRLRQVMEEGKLFGLSKIGREHAGLEADWSDLYMPTAEHHYGSSVFAAVDTGLFIFRCDPSHFIVAISDSTDREQWRQCQGHTMSLDLERNTVSRSFMLHNKVSLCGDVLQGMQSRQSELQFSRTSSPLEVACSLMRWFGPQVQADQRSVPAHTIVLNEGIAAIELVSDLIFHRNMTIFGNGNALKVGKHQLRVRAGAHLTIHQTILADSVDSSAVFVEGGMTSIFSTFTNNKASITALKRFPYVIGILCIS